MHATSVAATVKYEMTDVKDTTDQKDKRSCGTTAVTVAIGGEEEKRRSQGEAFHPAKDLIGPEVKIQSVRD